MLKLTAQDIDDILRNGEVAKTSDVDKWMKENDIDGDSVMEYLIKYAGRPPIIVLTAMQPGTMSVTLLMSGITIGYEMRKRQENADTAVS